MNLHDATLDSIKVDWPSQMAQIHMHAVGDRPVTIVAHQLRSLDLQRQDDWGPSDSILDVEKSEHDGCSRWVLHVQSGDDITVEAERIEIEE